MTDKYIEEITKVIEDITVNCFNCNVCYTVCPIDKSRSGFATDGPSGITQSVYHAIKLNLLDNLTEKEKEHLLNLIYSCTTCNSCELACKNLGTGREISKVIENSRRLMVEEGIGPLKYHRNVLTSIYLNSNPYEKAAADRHNWLNGLEVKMIPDQKAEQLLYVGCTASYDPELQFIAQNLVKIMQSLDIDFGILEEEFCCGCLAKRLGDELLFEEVRDKNIKGFLEGVPRKLITISPHCYHTFLNEYKNLEEFDIQHYTLFLNDLIQQGHKPFKKNLDYTVTYHDPCYLSKHNGIVDQPRNVITAIPGITLVEMTDNKEDSLCCGGGSGLIWADFDEEKRVANIRVEQALSAGANVIAVACPWCNVMLRTAVKDLGKEEEIQVKDLTELLIESMEL